MNSASGNSPMPQAMKFTTASSVLPERGGTLMISRGQRPSTTRSSAPAIRRWCRLKMNGPPRRSRKVRAEKASRSR